MIVQVITGGKVMAKNKHLEEAEEWLDAAQRIRDCIADGTELGDESDLRAVDERLEYARIEAMIAIAEELQIFNGFMMSINRHFERGL
jgi:hypothetical protein